ncbi:MAG: hypothetical protein UY07_C0018G0010 [Parcubacteria group bacterium GW2011_GWA1_47_8]|nr:MAG: hypothetical protein UY07_C0018G0010 [Parcubacteria group bacterium GW2011_GWA1_47_8]
MVRTIGALVAPLSRYLGERVGTREIGTSVFSFMPYNLPLFLVPGWYEKVGEVLKEINMGIQMLPLRGLREKHLNNFNVLSFEGPWNCGSVFGALARTIGINGDFPSLIDVGLFGSENVCRRCIEMLQRCCPNALAIDTPWIQDSAIELGPNMDKGNARQWGNQKPGGVVLDTGHWRKLKDPEKELEACGGFGSVRMVHLKLLSPDETMSFLHNKRNDENTRLLKNFLVHDTERKTPVIIEAKNDALQHQNKKTGEVLSRLAERIHEVLGD